MAIAGGELAVPVRANGPTDRARRIGARSAPWVLLGPTLCVLTLVGFYPLVYSLYTSFTGYRPTQPTKEQGYVGLENFARALTDGQFGAALQLTLIFTAVSVVMSLCLGLALAILFNKRLPGFPFIRSLLMLPMLITPISVGITWRIMMMPDYGVLNYLLRLIGLDPWRWTGSTSTALASVLLVDVWQWTPFMFIILLAGLRALPKSPFEAAAIDGAGPIRTFWLVTVPMLKPVIVIAVLLRMIDAFRTYDTIQIVTRGGPNLATDVVSVYLQRLNFRFFDLGYGSAVSWLVLLAILALVLVFVKLTGFMRDIADKEGR